MLSALFPKGKRMSHDPQSVPDIAFLRNIGMVLLALTVAVGAICVVGGLKSSELWVPPQFVDDNAAAADLMLIKPIQNISQPKE